MADSDNTTPLRLVTRRMILRSATAIPIAGWQPKAVAHNDLEKDQSIDPAVVVWRKWQAAQEQTERLCRQQQYLERKLAETVGFPCATIRLRGGEGVRMHSLRAIREVLDLGPEDLTVHAKAEADFAAHQARWDAVDREIGYSAALHAEGEAADRSEDLLEMLSETPALSLGGVVAKLDAVLREGEVSEDSNEFPWPQIRSTLDDVIRIGQQLVPEQMLAIEMLQLKPARKRKGRSLRVWAEADGGTA
ncbi:MULTISPECIES: hypothetical protein [unclassified Mesorhizobium]|uniref:hypothetical protein n=1 Tax=unclassified Mesorhizobium TaxID=325217 RepID=UPI001671E3EA|nr:MULTISPECIES: hypothetical protein [unclassified Mesorhizobium]